MSPDSSPKDQWERVAAELRAYRDLQQQAWGDVDNATIGRYLADEVDTEERRRVESALQELPELRKLTDLVRDVLCEFEPGLASTPQPPAAVPQAPVLLPFAPRRPTRQPFFNRRRAALVAAACLLLALGVGMPRPWSQLISPPSDQVAALHPESRSIDKSVAFKVADRPPPLVRGGSFHPKPADAKVLARMDKLDASVETLEKQGKLGDALALARAYPEVAREARLEDHPRYARSLNRVGLLYEKKGQLVEAEQSLRQACVICEKRLGPKHPDTVQSVKLLAGVYQLALNTSVAFAPTPNPISPYLPDYESFKKRLPYVQARMAKTVTPTVAPSFAGVVSEPEMTLSAVDEKTAWVADLTDTNFGFDPAVPGVNPVVVSGVALLTRAVQTWSAPAGARPMKAEPPRQRGEAVAFRYYLTRQRPAQLKQNVVPVLVEAWKASSTPKERVSLARALGQLGPAARPAVPVLTAYFKKTTDKAEQQAILRALGQMGPAARAAVPVLVSSLQSACPEARRSAADAIVRLGPAARDTVFAYRKIQPAADRLTLKVYQRLEGREGRIGVKDECDCFSVSALRQSTATIQRLARTANLEVLVETVPSLAPGSYDGKDCLRDMGPHGVHVVIAKQGPAVRVTVSDAVRKQGFAPEKLQKALEERLRRKDYDGGLTEGMRMLARFENVHNARKKYR